MKKTNIIALFITIIMLISTVPAFAAGEATLSGTISLPDGITAKDGDYIDIELRPMQRDERNRITFPGHDIYDGNTVYLEKGQTSAAYSVTAPKGSYALCVNAAVDGVHTWQQCYTLGGTVERLELAEPIALSSDKTANMTLTPYDYQTLSGTITMDKPSPRDGYISLTLGGVSGYDNYFSADIPVVKGQTSAKYSIKAEKGIYVLTVSNRPPFASGFYYSVKGDLLHNDTDRCYIDLRERPFTLDFTLNASYFIQDAEGNNNSGGSSSGTVGDEDWIDVTVKVPDGITADKFIEFYAKDVVDENSVNWFASADVPKTSTLVTADGVPQENDYYIVVNADWGGFYDDTEYYYSRKGGLTTDIDEAAVFKDNWKTITIDLSDAFSVISGTVSRNGTKIGEAIEFNLRADVSSAEDDMSFYADNLIIGENENSTTYTILIPKELSGEAKLTLEYCYQEISDRVTLPGYVTTNIDLINKFHKISGTVTLTSPAPKGGAAVQIYQSNNSYANYYIPQGKRNVDYEYYALNDSEELVFESLCTDKRYEQWASAEIDNETAECDAEIIMYTEAISGTVSMKDGASMPNAVSYKVTAVAYDENDEAIDSMEQYGTIFPDGAAGKYSINLPDTTDRTEVSLEILAEGDMELTVIPDDNDKDFVLTPDVGVTYITAEYDADNDNISIDYTSDGKADYTALAIVAVYNENNALAAIHTEEITFDKEGADIVFHAEIGDGITEDSSVRLFIWRSFKSLKPVTDGEITLNMTSNQGGE